MKWREGRVPNWHLIALAALSLAVYTGALATTRKEVRPHYAEKIAAAQTALLAQQAIREELQRRGYAVDVTNDPWNTGLIGLEATETTSDRGFATAKILATDPNASAAFVDMLVRARVKKGDRVAIGVTGSLPGWNIAILAACKAMGVTPVVITSVGSSDWGANRPDMTWLDMERILREEGILPYTSVAASLGGGGDRGRGMSVKGRSQLREAIDRNGIPFIETRTLQQGIEERMAIYRQHAGDKPYALYINVGGGMASLGGRYNNQLIRPGYSRRLQPGNYPINAVINRMSQQGIPVVNLTSVDVIARRYGTGLVTGDAPQVGVGPLYFEERVDVTGTALLTVFLAAVVFVVIRLDLKHYMRRNPRSRTAEDGI